MSAERKSGISEAEAKEQARAQTTAMIEQAREDIRIEQETARKQLSAEVTNLAVEVAEKLVRQHLNPALRQQELIDKLIDELADDKDRQEITAIKLFVNKRAEDAARTEIDDEALKDHYEVNRAQYPGTFEAEKERIMNTLVRIKAASKADELDKEVEAVRKTLKYWKPEN